LESLSIRKIRAEDAGDIGRVHAAFMASEKRIDFSRVITEQVLSQENGSFVAELEGRLVGYMIAYTIHGGFGLEKIVWIATLGVDPKYMGQGVGKRLAEEIFRHYKGKGITHIYTSARWDSVDLLSFFKTLGFDRSSFINLVKELEL
jgi:predicted N-acetyltransferase YhbS